MTDREGVPIGINMRRYMHSVVIFRTILSVFNDIKTIEDRIDVFDIMMCYLLTKNGQYFMRMSPPKVKESIKNKLSAFMGKCQSRPDVENNMRRVWSAYFR